MYFVELRSFDNYIEANIVLKMLQSFDVNCHLKDENTVALNPIWTQAVGGIKIMVAEEDFDQAAANGVEMAPPLNGGGAPYLEEEDREKLGKVLRDLLEMKRMLERARG